MSEETPLRTSGVTKNATTAAASTTTSLLQAPNTHIVNERSAARWEPKFGGSRAGAQWVYFQAGSMDLWICEMARMILKQIGASSSSFGVSAHHTSSCQAWTGTTVHAAHARCRQPRSPARPPSKQRERRGSSTPPRLSISCCVSGAGVRGKSCAERSSVGCWLTLKELGKAHISNVSSKFSTFEMHTRSISAHNQSIAAAAVVQPRPLHHFDLCNTLTRKGGRRVYGLVTLALEDLALPLAVAAAIAADGSTTYRPRSMEVKMMLPDGKYGKLDQEPEKDGVSQSGALSR